MLHFSFSTKQKIQMTLLLKKCNSKCECNFCKGTYFLSDLIFNVVLNWIVSISVSDDHIAIGSDCDELGAQIEEHILSFSLLKSYCYRNESGECDIWRQHDLML